MTDPSVSTTDHLLSAAGKRLEGTRVLVAGGTSGSGAVVVDRLRLEGAAVVFTDQDERRGTDLARSSGATFVVANTTAASVRHSVDEAVAVLDGLDAMVLNVGIGNEVPLADTPDSVWDGLLEANLIAPYRYVVACLPALRAVGGGSITAISSAAGIWPETSMGAFSVSKRALVMLVQMLAVEVGPDGIRANAVCPTEKFAATEGGTGRHGPRDTLGWLLPPLGRLSTAADVAGAVAFFVSRDSAFCNGSVLLVDGGMSAALRANLVMNQEAETGETR